MNKQSAIHNCIKWEEKYHESNTKYGKYQQTELAAIS